MVVGSEKWVDVHAVEQVLEGADNVVTTNAPTGACQIATERWLRKRKPLTLFNVEVAGLYESLLRHALESVECLGHAVEVHVFVVDGEPDFELHDFAAGAMQAGLPVQVHASVNWPKNPFVVTV